MGGRAVVKSTCVVATADGGVRVGGIDRAVGVTLHIRICALVLVLGLDS